VRAEVQHLKGDTMRTLSQILAAKPAEIFTVRPTDSVLVALQIMATYNVGALPVVSAQGLVGIISERDYARKVALNGLTSAVTEVRDIMSSSVVTAQLGQSVMECMNMMTTRHIRHLPVVQQGELVGMLSIGDLVKAVIEDQQFNIQQLESYISPQNVQH
jgi:CBS domain-containing protein